MSRETLLRQAAGEYHLEAACLLALTQVETGGKGGFLPDGRVRILFERHILFKRLIVRGLNPVPLAKDHPELCGRIWDPKAYPYGGEAYQWTRVDTVVQWARNHEQATDSYLKAAWESCSWGLFQLLGMNYAAAGFPDVIAFANAMKAGEGQQVGAALHWMDHTGILAPLRAKNWDAVAERYNGTGQVAYYASRLAEAYEHFKN